MKKIVYSRGRQLMVSLLFLNTLFTTSCTVGPNYVRPSVAVPSKYKEARVQWKVAKPQDEFDRGEWWTLFNKPELNTLENQVNVSNQNIASAEAAYRQAVQLVYQARAAYFPTLSATTSVTRQKTSALIPGREVTTTINGSGAAAGSVNGTINTDDFVGLQASWVPDLWGNIRRTVEQDATAAQASKAQLAAMTLSMQATLAQDYFQLRALDRDQKILDDTVIADKKTLALTKAGMIAGVNSLADVATAEAQLKTVEAAAIDNHIARAQFEHAIAVLIGKPPADFTLKPKLIVMKSPQIPLSVPSSLLERRPDIANAERLMASANAAIGVAISAYFPTLAIAGTYGYETFSFNHWFSPPMLFWSIGPALTETVLDGGLRLAKTNAARAAYDQAVANYRQTVLAAFQNVEDNLVALHQLKSEILVQHQAVVANQLSLKLLLAEYKAGTVAYTAVVVTQINTLAAEKAESDMTGRQMVAAVGLIEALGGGWDTSQLNKR